MSLQKISARQVGVAPTRISFTFNPNPGVTPGGVVTHQRQGTEDAISFKAALDANAALRGLTPEMPFPYFIHVNDDGTVAVATGEEPAVWPEDESP